jgi:hypothetical protein
LPPHGRSFEVDRRGGTGDRDLLGNGRDFQNSGHGDGFAGGNGISIDIQGLETRQ